MKETNALSVADYLATAAGIPHPWRAIQYRIDDVAEILHVWVTRQPRPNIARKRSWFGLGTPQPVAETPASGPELQWRHLNCMRFSCQIHTTDVLDERHFELPWFGQLGLPFTNQLSRQVFACLSEGMEMSALCEIFHIPFGDMWKFKHALDNGQLAFEYAATKKPNAAALGAAAPLQPAAAASNVPDIGDPVWERIITGTLNIHIKTLSLQLILTKLRQQVSLQQSEDVKRLKLRELHKYVDRNQRSLGYELGQIKALSATETV